MRRKAASSVSFRHGSPARAAEQSYRNLRKLLFAWLPTSFRPSRHGPLCLALLTASCSLALLMWTQPTSRWQRVKSLSGLTAFASRCDLDAVTQGQWVQAFDHQALEDFATPRQLQYPDDFHCYAEDGRSLDEARLVRAANWVWQPRSAECAHLPAVDRFVILDRLLRMPEGAVFIGDSLAAEQFSALRVILEADDVNPFFGTSRVAAKHAAGSNMILHSTLDLNPHGTLHAKLLATGNYSAARLEQPLAHSIRSHFLLSQEEVRDIVPGDNVTTSFFVWGNDPDYMAVLQEIGMAYERESAAEHDQDGSADRLDTLVVFNSGPHWSPVKVLGLPPDRDPLSALYEGYSRMVPLVIKRLRSLPSHFRFIYRSNVFVQEPCDHSWKQPSAPSEDVRLSSQYNYAWFERYDDLWRQQLDGLPRSSFFNVREMTRLRSDAKMRPPGDCLHTAAPVSKEIHRQMWRSLLAL